MNKLIIGQRYMSEAEPELGLGVLGEIEDKTIIVLFNAVLETRRYGRKTAPLKRIIFDIGDEVTTNSSQKFIVTHREQDEDGLYIYQGEESQEIIETQLLDSVSFNKPEEKLVNACADPATLFELRNQTLQNRIWLSKLNIRGFIGGRLSLIAHQLYLANKITKRFHPRVLLADEVGLGKTIEAGLIINRLLITNRAQRFLIMVPNTLCFQWFIEMLRKYNLSFSVINEQTNLEPGTNPFEENNLVITSFQLYYGSDLARNLITNAHWDILTIDEAHKIKWKKDEENKHYNLIKTLTNKIKSLLLLTATPEMFGLEGHFARLHLIDPDRFYCYDTFIEENTHLKINASIGNKALENEPLSKEETTHLESQNISFTSNKDLLKTLLDTHGTGRVYFRNTRKVMSKIYDFFPERIPCIYPLESNKTNTFFNKLEDDDDNFESDSYQERILWLAKFLSQHQSDKVLLIARSKKKILEIEKDLLKISTQNKISLFHSDLSLMARDRQAAYFSDPDGANLLLCTEIGSEGRNFEFAHHLVIFDLPNNPELLEQRIGRLDRIGQKQDIHLHIPYLKDSWEEILFKWYQEGLNAFSQTTKGGMKAIDFFKKDLHFAFTHVEEYLSGTQEKMSALLKETKIFYNAGLSELEAGRDKLVELNSFHEEDSISIINQIKEVDADSDRLKSYLENIFGHFGVDCEDLDESSQFIKPSDNMFIPYFPCLPADGLSYTFSRKKALEREDLVFMTWDHPLVIGVMELFLGQEFGNLTIATRKKASDKPKIFLEVYFVLETYAPKYLEVHNYLPPEVIRVLINPEMADFSSKFPKELLDQKLTGAERSVELKISKFPKKTIKEILSKAESIATIEAKTIINNSKKYTHEFFDDEISRLTTLQKLNKTIKDEEIDEVRERKQLILDHIEGHAIQLDSFRFIY